MADKGGSVVILSRKHYKDMVVPHVNESTIYKTVDKYINCQI